jgi:23S rRNA (guanine745-N1)-methyltransferase
MARSGYVNLLQPQDRRSPDAGDSREAIEARGRLLAGGIGRDILASFIALATGYASDSEATIVDLGCGSGDLIGSLAARHPRQAIGIDLSVAAIDRAARRFRDATWIVANADRRLPLLDASVALVLSLHARRNPAEAQRVLAPGGYLLVGVPAADDLIELRTAVQGSRVERDRVDRVIAEHEPYFMLVSRSTAREHHRLSGDQVRDALHGTYRGARTSMADALDQVGALDVTFASEFLVLRSVSLPGAYAVGRAR